MTETAPSPLAEQQPDDPAIRLIVFGIRRMGAHGLHDACAAQAFLAAFGKDFRRPLTLLRTFVAELSTISTKPITIAPICCPRMTPAEATLVTVLARALSAEATAALLLADLLGLRDAGAPMATGSALAIAFADLGLPLG